MSKGQIETPANRASYHDFYDTSWNAGALRPLLIALIAASFVAGPLAILRALTSWRLAYVLPIAFGVALLGAYSTNQLGRPRWRDRRGLAFRIGELFCILLLLRVLVWVFSASLPDLDDLALWLSHPGAFFDGQFVTSGVLLLIAWAFAVSMAADFNELAIQPDEVAAHDSVSLSESRSQMRVFRPVGRTDIMGRFASRWAWGGVALVAMAALSRIDLGVPDSRLGIGLGSLGLPFYVLAAMLCYFVVGLALLSQTRLAVLRGRWYNQDIEVHPTVLRRWHLSALAAMLIIAVIAALLPLGSTGRFSPLVAGLLNIMVRVFFFVMGLITLLLTILFSPFLRLFDSNAPPPAPAPPPALDLAAPARAAPTLPPWLGGMMVWLVVGLLLAYFIFNYLKAYGVFQGKWADLLVRLRYWWRARWARIETTAGIALASVRARLRPVGIGAAEGTSRRRLRPGQLPPRERVRYFYLRMIERAHKSGVARPPAATPLEFADLLDREWPEAETDLSSLTEAFLAARYTPRDIPGTEASDAQDIWRRVMRALRTRTSPESPAK